MAEISNAPELPDLSKNPFKDSNGLRKRVSLQFLQQAHDAGFREPLDKVVRAWHGIQDKSRIDPDDRDGFFVIAGYHGEPFHGPGKSDPQNYWGGYCNHGNVLFPTWHRAYLWRLEQAMRKIDGCDDVTLPFWDEFAAYQDPTKPHPAVYIAPIPKVLTDKDYVFSDGKTIPNPLKSYKFPKGLTDAKGANDRYSKPKDYETVRYPLSGLVGAYDKRMTDLYNKAFNENDLTDILNANVMSWINQGPDIYGDNIKKDDKDVTQKADSLSVGVRLKNCLNAPNYMVFSNKTSSTQWVEDHGLQGDAANALQSLESPHNAIHLAIGGCYLQSEYNANQEVGFNANGDMGENNTASMDPIFFFHHCFVDYVFHLWQKKNELTKRGDLTVEMGYAGTNSSDSGAPPLSQPANTFLDMDTPLYPFTKKKADGYKVIVETGPGSWLTSHDVTDIEEMGYTYGPGTMDPLIKPVFGGPEFDRGPNLAATKRVSGINRMDFGGSFVVRTFAIGADGTRFEVGRDEVLSRWNLEGCRNCQNTLAVKTFVPVPETIANLAAGEKRRPKDVRYEVRVQGHHGAEEVVDAKIDDWSF